MRNRNLLMRAGIMTFAALMFIGSMGATNAKAQNPIAELLNRMDSHYKNLTSLQSGVTMVKYNSQIGRSDTTQGTTNYLPKTTKHPMYVRIDWTKPINESMLVIGEDYKLYRPALSQVIVGKANSGNVKGAGNALAFLSMSKEQLKANYVVRYVGPEQISGGLDTWHLEMTPKTATSYKKADLWVDKDGMPRQAMITEANDDTTTILLSSIKENIDIDAKSVFVLTYPKGTKEIRG